LCGEPAHIRVRLIGRETDRAAARAYLIEKAVPLLTLTSPGGVGKNRLALAIAGEVAEHFADGVVWVDLAPLADPNLVPATIATANRSSPGRTRMPSRSSSPGAHSLVDMM
jgi:predicted ATPase